MQNIASKNNHLEFHYKSSSFNKTLFLDRDGVINKAVMRKNNVSSPRSENELIFFEDISVINKKFIQDSYNVIIVSNQPDIERRIIDFNFIEIVNKRIMSKINVNSIYICPHTQETNCKCRKPKIGLFENYYKYNSKSKHDYFIGDRYTDLQCSNLLGIPFILKLNEYNKNLREKADYVIDNFSQLEKIL